MITEVGVPGPAIEPTTTERDLAAAARLQRMLLPPSPFVARGWEAVHRYEPAGIGSGDYIDLVPHGQRLYFMLGDVSGKGVAASMLMAQLHAMFRTLIPFELSMEELTKRASALLCASSLPAQYATLVFGFLANDGEAVITNAGHPPPILLSDGRTTEVRASGVPIGLFCESQFSSTRVTLADGDTLLIYTDGLTEAGNPGGEEYGAERVAEVANTAADASLAGLLDATLAAQGAFRSSRPNTDDLTVLAIRRTSQLSDSEAHRCTPERS